eukprot:Gregarina_sp_Poly_1__1802@NODE_1468_length_4062_cov_97_329161_g972_i0_p1_GENE_NODE_1468_length_4062_cov_97_329161_g972_i0NODE_1468_length_4062_cov_97_329161_g972_i0_p1_ORF_typecomplete_len806_score78_76Vps54_N/PF10475_9/1_4e09Sec5/PF15469_6/0_0027Sec5/PF15469_6/4_4e03DUF3388/PF11868_8/2_4e02DUF3388/PF11868_8/0_17Sec8_exocyst/PF04048_14/0_22Sec8_exocyst/PF04048_14/1_9e03COG2/PF06148_11/0_18DUF2465/PF10239_9/0_19COG5/PF10392_9/0_6Fer4_24/PF18109_1/1_4Fer4_24/PF18109_1/1_4e03Dor1/PF04124_12/0_54_NO
MSTVNVQRVFDDLIDEAYLSSDSTKELLAQEVETYRRTQQCQTNISRRVLELETVSHGIDAKIRTMLFQNSDAFLSCGSNILLHRNEFHTAVAKVSDCREKLEMSRAQFASRYGDLVQRNTKRRKLQNILSLLLQCRAISRHMQEARELQSKGDYVGALKSLSHVVRLEHNLNATRRLRLLDDIAAATVLQIHQIPDEVVFVHLMKASFMKASDTKSLVDYLTISIRLLDLSSTDTHLLEQRIATQLSHSLVTSIQIYLLKNITGAQPDFPIDEKQLATVVQKTAPEQVSDVLFWAWDGFENALKLYWNCWSYGKALENRNPQERRNPNSADWKIFKSYLECHAPKFLASLLCLLESILKFLPLPPIQGCTFLSDSVRVLGILSIITCGLIDDFARQLSPEAAIDCSSLEEAFMTRILQECDRLRHETLQDMCDWVSHERWRRVAFTKLYDVVLDSTHVHQHMFDFYREHMLKKKPIKRLLERQNPFHCKSIWLNCAKCVADFVCEVPHSSCEGSQATSDSLIGCELTHKVLIAMQDNIRILKLLPALVTDVTASIRDLWDFMVCTVVLTFAPKDYIKDVLLTRELAHTSPNCVGGPQLYKAYSIFLKQQQVFDLRALIQKIRNRRFKSESQTTNILFPSNYEPLIPDNLNRATAMNGCLERILASCSMDTFRAEIAKSLLQPLKIAYSGKDPKNINVRLIKKFEQEMELIAAPMRELLLGHAAKNFLNVEEVFSGRLKEICKTDVVEVADHPDVVLLQSNFSRALKDAIRHLQVLNSGSVPSDKIREFYRYVWKEVNFVCCAYL